MNKNEKKSGDNAVREDFSTPLTARPPADDDLPLPTLEQLEAERRKMAEEKAAESATAATPAAPAAPAAAPAAPPRERRELPPLLLPNHGKPPLEFPDGFTTGAFLKKVREDAKLSLKQVEEATRISQRYLKALENDEFSRVPPAVYVIAYLRKLSDFYNISHGACEHMIGSLREKLKCDELPDEIINQVELDTEPAEEEEREVRKLLWIAGGVAAGLLLLLVLAGVWLFGCSRTPAPAAAPGAAAKPAVSSAELYEVLPEPSGAVPELGDKH